MSGFIEGEDRNQATLFPERIDDYITEDSAVRVIDVFVDELDLSGLGFKTVPEATGRPGYNPALMLKLFIYGYLNRVQSSRRLEQEANRKQHQQIGKAVGEGIVCGLEVGRPAETSSLTEDAAVVVSVQNGLALNRKGQALYLPEKINLALVREEDQVAAQAGWLAATWACSRSTSSRP